MKAIDIHNHMASLGDWVDWSATCDGFKAGDPQSDVKGIAVAWQSTLPNLRLATEKGCNLFITHEPTFYVHMDDSEAVFRHEYAAAKLRFIEESGLTIYRCHDVWDVFPDIGILDSWASGLGFDSPPAAAVRYHSAYPFTGTVRNLACHVRERVAAIGQSVVEAIGDPDQPVSCVALGTGAITDFHTMLGLGADACIMTDDGMAFWSAGCQAVDSGVPLIIVNHATAEEWGVRNLAAYVARQFPDIPVHHLPMGCLYHVV